MKLFKKIKSIFTGKKETSYKFREELIKYKPSKSEYLDIQKKLGYDNFNAKDLKFDTDDLTNYNLSSLSSEAKNEIIEIIKRDNRKRVAGYENKFNEIKNKR